MKENGFGLDYGNKKNDRSNLNDPKEELIENKNIIENNKSVGEDNYKEGLEKKQIKNVKDFFELLYPDNVKGKIVLWIQQTNQTFFFDLNKKDEIENCVKEYVLKGNDVYYNVSLQNYEMAKKEKINREKKKIIEKSFKDIFLTTEYKKDQLLKFAYEEKKEEMKLKGLKMSKEEELKYKSKFLTLKDKSKLLKNAIKNPKNKEIVRKHKNYYLKYMRGFTSTTESSFGIWMDVDINVDGHHKDNERKFNSFDEAYNFLMSLDIKPTLIINSGGGFHVYYLLKEPIFYKNNDERKDFQDLVTKVTSSIKEHARLLNADNSFDPVSDLARTLRVPFTKNFKVKDNIKDVTIFYQSNKRYEIKELEVFVLEDINELINKAKRKRKNKNNNNNNNNNNNKKFKMKLSDGTVKTFFANQKNVLADPELMYEGCAFIKYCVDNQNDVSYKEWISLLQTVLHCKDGYDYAHRWSKEYDGYDKFNTDYYIDTIIDRLDPITHDFIRNELGFDGCDEKGCSEFHSPISLGYKSNHK